MERVERRDGSVASGEALEGRLRRARLPPLLVRPRPADGTVEVGSESGGGDGQLHAGERHAPTAARLQARRRRRVHLLHRRAVAGRPSGREAGRRHVRAGLRLAARVHRAAVGGIHRARLHHGG